MSRSTDSTFTCPCGNVFNSPIYEYVNVADDPQLQYTVLAGLLNVSTCPICGRRAALSRPFIYSDPAHSLLAYVHPSPDIPEEARQLILEKLRNVYQEADAEAAHLDSTEERAHRGGSHNGNGTATGTKQSQEMPHLHVVFGLDQLNELINASLSQDERLGRLALSTRSRSNAERGQFLDIARKLASEMNCQVEVEELPDEYTVWLYGSRRQIGALMRELAPRG
jgi:hypothetical protein